jgi:hypothetical protein
MPEKLVVKPPAIYKETGKVLFLGGPIQGAPDWQADAIKIIHSQDSGLIIASPRKNYPEGTFIYENQVDWESSYLKRAAKHGGIMFWLANQTEETPGGSYAQNSRFELGEWKEKHQERNTPMVVGIEDGFSNERYIRRRFSQDCPEVPILDNLQETCETIVELLKLVPNTQVI